jgi:hypothetical protein
LETVNNNLKVYENAAEKYKPKKIRVLFIAESPPFFKEEKKRAYFYFEDNPGKDVLFATLVKAIYDFDYRKNTEEKKKLLTQFKEDGFFLIDAVEYPINRDKNWRMLRNKEREVIIKEEFPNLLNKLDKFKKDELIDSETRIILIKKIVFNALFPVLKQSEYNVINRGKIDFPKYFRDRDVIREIGYLLSKFRS